MVSRKGWVGRGEEGVERKAAAREKWREGERRMREGESGGYWGEREREGEDRGEGREK